MIDDTIEYCLKEAKRAAALHPTFMRQLIVFLLERERDRKREIRLEALALLENLYPYEGNEELHRNITWMRKELEGT